MAEMFIVDTLYEPEDKKAFYDAICAFLDAHPIELPREEQLAIEAKRAQKMAERYPGLDIGLDTGIEETKGSGSSMEEIK